MRTRALLIDYGEVISAPQPPEQLAAMAALCGLQLTHFVSRYWEHRPDYDRGAAPREYWTAVAQPNPVDDAALAELTRRDLDSWLELNQPVLDVLAQARDRGLSLSLLSNAPHDLAEHLSQDQRFAVFEHLLFSSQLGLVKPEPAVFELTVARLGLEPGEILFIDDRADNVAGARECGLQAAQFTGAEELRAQLSRLGGATDHDR